LTRTADGWIVPVHSVGVQGDSRSYRPVLAIEDAGAGAEETADLVNRSTGVNRVVAFIAGHRPMAALSVVPASLSMERLDRLRRVDALVREHSHSSGFDRRIWQFPVALIPVGDGLRPDSVVLRPIDSVDGMTAQAVRMPPALLSELTRNLLAVEGIAAVFYDLTNKPPATIEWE
jgi:GMP synthase (glutamine-hydrolysing)